MIRRYVIGGIAFITTAALVDVPTDGFADADLDVFFLDRDAFDDLLDTEIRRIDGPGTQEGAIDVRAKTCWLPTRHADPTEPGWQLRQMAPIFSTLMDRLVLHASAVEMARGVIGFIGGSGAGKSTLAHFLSEQGDRFVSDDLLPIRFAPAAQSPVGTRLRPVAALCLLRRENTKTITLHRLSAVAAIEGLIHNGFGEHGDSQAWHFQFDAYHRLAESVPIFGLAIPDDHASLPRVRAALKEALDDNLDDGRLN